MVDKREKDSEKETDTRNQKEKEIERGELWRVKGWQEEKSPTWITNLFYYFHELFYFY